MSITNLPLDEFPAWAKLNGIDVTALELRDIPGKGAGFVAAGDIDASEEGHQLLRVPRDLSLSSETVDEFGKVDGSFRQLLDQISPKSTRDKLLLYLLVQRLLTKQDAGVGKGVVSTAWTEYLRFLPETISVPSLWTRDERELLRGTSLEDATRAKINALESEFETLRESSSQLLTWNDRLWKNESATSDDWYLVDAWYRSRCLEMPEAGVVMVPGLDMINHANEPNAIYEETNTGDIILRLRSGHSARKGDEITISYGSAKPPAEMLFNYGFIEATNATEKLVLSLDTPDDDPLGRAKQHAFGSPPIATIIRNEGGRVEWTSPFAHLMCLNEEDGLDFRVLQDQDGGRHLRMFWQDEDVSDKADAFEHLIRDHPLEHIFRLRTVATLQHAAEGQLEILQEPIPGYVPDSSDPRARNERGISAGILRGIETRILQATTAALENEKMALLAHPRVIEYLGLMEESQNGQVADASANEEPDFS